MNVADIVNWVLQSKEHWILIGTGIVTIATGLVNILPEPTDKSNVVYKAIHNAVHFLSGNKQIQYYLDKAKAK